MRRVFWGRQLPATTGCAIGMLCVAVGSLPGYAGDALTGGKRKTVPRLVSIRKGTPFPEVLDTIHAAAAVPCFAEAPTVQGPTKQDFTGTVPETLEMVQKTFDLRPVWRDNRIVFMRQYSDPSLVADLPLAELRLIVRDLGQILGADWAKAASTSGIKDRTRDALMASLSPEQWRLLENGSLPAAQLQPEQMRLCGVIAASTTLSGVERIDRLARTLDGWPSDRLRVQGKECFLHFPDPRVAAGEYYIPLPISLSGSPTGTTTFALVASSRSSFGAAGRTLALPHGEITLSAVDAKLGEVLGPEARVPPYATSRRLVVAATKLDISTAMRSVADIYGWQVRVNAVGQPVWARPTAAPARDLVELHALAARAVPPSLRMLMLRNGWSQYRECQLAAITGRVADERRDTVIRINTLDEEQQQRTAQLFAVCQLRDFIRFMLTLGRIPAWASTPDRVFLTYQPPQENPRFPGRLSLPMVFLNSSDKSGQSDFIGWAFKPRR